MKAIIFAAGCSTRLGELTVDLPKCCLKVSDDQTILQRALTSIKENGVEHVTIVTGFAAEKINEEVEQWKDTFRTIETVYNPHYEERNNIYTAYLVRNLIDSDTIIINSDLVFDTAIMKKTVTALKDSDNSFFVVDDQKQLVDEDMKILVDHNNTIIRIHKSLDNNKAKGEYIGILRLAGSDLITFKKSLEEMIDRKDFSKYYEDAIDEKLADMSISYISTDGLPWTEVDSKDDYKKATQQVGHHA